MMHFVVSLSLSLIVMNGCSWEILTVSHNELLPDGFILLKNVLFVVEHIL